MSASNNKCARTQSPLSTMKALSSGTVVWLHSLNSDSLNGQAALIMRDTDRDSLAAASKGRSAVQLIKDMRVLSIRPENLSLSPPAYFAIMEAPDKGGLGIYATQDIAAGVGVPHEQWSLLTSIIPNCIHWLSWLCKVNKSGVLIRHHQAYNAQHVQPVYAVLLHVPFRTAKQEWHCTNPPVPESDAHLLTIQTADYIWSWHRMRGRCFQFVCSLIFLKARWLDQSYYWCMDWKMSAQCCPNTESELPCLHNVHSCEESSKLVIGSICATGENAV